MPKTKGLTLKQSKFLKKYFETGNGTEAALYAYDTDDIGSAAQIAYENLIKLDSHVKTLMEKKGLSLGRLVDVLDDGLEANRVISAVNTGKQASGATSDFIEVPDHAVRHKFLETAGKWLGVQKEADVNIQVNVKQILGGKTVRSNDGDTQIVEAEQED
ncbi:MAG: hypothetical protein DRP09_11030 [Candidatus Thorarchaeota archaeon]|nr:MAG: hypothetical protein DRP09_11030 [Candidatus Thorarchaeota archaeon]